MSSPLQYSARAKKIVPIFLFTAIAAFVSFTAHMISNGTSAFPAGYVRNGRYLVEGHGKVIELTREQFLTGYVLGYFMVLTILLYFGVVAYFYWTGDVSKGKQGE